ncbi:uncharacterized protein A1O9_12655 [Exophiala aquamarina CBS 119918]|uniref:RRM domain-containing protein n=1 Tax=Exophiala aquamarina CBS 119918 TaxID=1182545 RepID=A0A072P6V5_9EURO|nr:uncharacterized protein A1O9_12655 [Exophiala aquamarina CBS 119918]KEF51305.1 hypothetical protein A1O9_12655 [Exophiala aquamarina CBS 119918]
MDDAGPSPPPQRERQPMNFRSTASTNWRMKDDSPRAEQPQRRGGGFNRSNGQRDANNPDESASGTRLYVGNLLYTAQKADIEALFTEQGFNVVNVSISTDPFTGRNPSYCFVDLASEDEAQRAIAELNGIEVLGRNLRVSPGVAKRGQGQGQGQGRTTAGTGSGDVGNREVRTKNYERGWAKESREERGTDYKPSFDRWNRNDASAHWQAPLSEGRRLYIGNLPRIEPQSAVDEEMQTLFATHLASEGITPSAVSKLISPHPSKASEPGNHFYCFVDLERAEDVETVIAALDGREGGWGGALRVNRAREQRDRAEGGRDRKVVREQGLNREREGEERSVAGGASGAGGWRNQQ